MVKSKNETQSPILKRSQLRIDFLMYNPGLTFNFSL